MPHVRPWAATNAASSSDLFAQRAAIPSLCTVMRPPKPSIFIASPARRDANNGNWQTASRWTRFLRGTFDVSSDVEWIASADPGKAPACLIALHARRSAESVARFAQACPGRPIVVVLTGTDLYRDIRSDESAQRSLDLATHLVTLQDEGPHELSEHHRAKCRVIYQSASYHSSSPPHAQREDSFDIAFVGHMRAEKDPLTPMRALDCLPNDSRVRLVHIGSALEDKYRVAAQTLQARRWPGIQRYLWLGALPHAQARRRIGNAQALVISSVMEGGANVIIEAVNAGVPVIASDVRGNVGMLGRDYKGYFAVGKHEELAGWLDRISRDEAVRDQLCQQCARRNHLFAPEREKAHVNELIRDALTVVPSCAEAGSVSNSAP